MMQRIRTSLLSLGLVLATSCSNKQTNMSQFKEIKTAIEIRAIAGRAASAVIPDEAGETLPVATRLHGKPVIQILYYPTFASPGGRVVGLPDHCMLLDAVSGKVLRFWECTPAEIGLRDRAPTVPGAGIPPDMSLEEHSAKRAQLAAISKPVWEAFFQGGVPIAPDTRALVREYRQLFLQTTNEEVAG